MKAAIAFCLMVTALAALGLVVVDQFVMGATLGGQIAIMLPSGDTVVLTPSLKIVRLKPKPPQPEPEPLPPGTRPIPRTKT